MKIFQLLIAVLLCSNIVYAAALPDLSGNYQCNGSDQDGPSSATDHFVLDTDHSTDKVAGYQVTFTMISERGKINYHGFGTFDGTRLAIYFANDNLENKNDYGLTLAQITPKGYQGVYYQPAYEGGETGVITECVKTSSK